MVASRPFAPTAQTDPPHVDRALKEPESKFRQVFPSEDMSEPEVPVAIQDFRAGIQRTADRKPWGAAPEAVDQVRPPSEVTAMFCADSESLE
jgi:hypothetical protein